MKTLQLSILLFVLLVAGCGTDKTVTFSAAASTKDAFEEITKQFNEIEPDVTVDMNFGGSGALTVQIEQGAPVDLFLSANMHHFETLEEAGHIAESEPYIGNQLVLIAPEDSTLEQVEDLTTVDNLAIGTPASVPAGAYAEMALSDYELWDDVETSIVYAEDVRQVLQYVEIGEVDAGIVYYTDAISSSKVHVVDKFEATSHDEILYPLALTTNGAENESAQLFYAFLLGDDAVEVFRSYGFTIE